MAMKYVPVSAKHLFALSLLRVSVKHIFNLLSFVVLLDCNKRCVL
jgi:hypothetical protein